MAAEPSENAQRRADGGDLSLWPEAPGARGGFDE